MAFRYVFPDSLHKRTSCSVENDLFALAKLSYLPQRSTIHQWPYISQPKTIAVSIRVYIRIFLHVRYNSVDEVINVILVRAGDEAVDV